MWTLWKDKWKHLIFMLCYSTVSQSCKTRSLSYSSRFKKTAPKVVKCSNNWLVKTSGDKQFRGRILSHFCNAESVLKTCWNKEIQKKRFFYPQATISQWACFSHSCIQRDFELHQPLAPAPSTSWRCSSHLLAAVLVYRVPPVLYLHSCLSLPYKSNPWFSC